MRRCPEEKEGDTFFEKVYAVVRRIPYGRVTSYGAVAEYLGTRGSARMVGWAMNSSHSQARNVPAHRVVNRVGLLTGKHHFGGLTVMKQLLENEGIGIENDQVLRFDSVFWDPVKELNRERGKVNRSAKKSPLLVPGRKQERRQTADQKRTAR